MVALLVDNTIVTNYSSSIRYFFAKYNVVLAVHIAHEIVLPIVSRRVALMHVPMSRFSNCLTDFRRKNLVFVRSDVNNFHFLNSFCCYFILFTFPFVLT